MQLQQAVFIDRDGTLNQVVINRNGQEDSPFRPEEVALLPGAGEFTRAVRAAGYLAILATNQPGVAKGIITIVGLKQIHDRLIRLLAAHGGGIDHVYYCPHNGTGYVRGYPPFLRQCTCRKPGPGMLMRAAAELRLDLSLSWMVGDRLTDVEAGHTAGCRTILLSPNLKARVKQELSRNTNPDHIAGNLLHALEFIIHGHKMGA